MSAPPLLEHVALPDWFGVGLVNGQPGDSAADALATAADVGDVVVEDIVGTDAAFDGYGMIGTVLATYRKSLFDEAYLYGGSNGGRELARVGEAALAGLLDSALGKVVVFTGGMIPFLDVFVKALARKHRISVGDAMIETLRLVLLAWFGRPEDLARLRARAQMHELSRAAEWLVTAYDDGVAQTFESLIADLKEPLDLDRFDDEGDT